LLDTVGLNADETQWYSRHPALPEVGHVDFQSTTAASNVVAIEKVRT